MAGEGAWGREEDPLWAVGGVGEARTGRGWTRQHSHTRPRRRARARRKHRRGIDPGEGQIFIDRLQAGLEKLGGEVQVNSRVLRAIREEGGEVVGLEVRVGHRTELIGARQGIVFGTGGFLHDEQMATAYL